MEQKKKITVNMAHTLSLNILWMLFVEWVLSPLIKENSRIKKITFPTFF